MDMDLDITASNEHGTGPPATVTNTLSPGENDNGGSWAGSSVGADASKGKGVVVPNDVDGGEGGAAAGDNTDADLPKAEDGATGGAARGRGEDKAHSVTERERRKRMKNMFSTLHSLVPQLPEKTDKATIVGEAINYIKSLEHMVAKLEKRKQELALARQAAELESASSSAPRPHAAQGAAIMSSAVVPHGHGLGWQQQPAPPPQLPVVAVTTAAPVGFQTWSGSNVVLSVSGVDAYISLCAPRCPGVLTLVLSVLDKHGIGVVAAHVASNGARSMFMIHTRVNGAGGENPAPEDLYKLAVSEIMVWLCS